MFHDHFHKAIGLQLTGQLLGRTTRGGGGGGASGRTEVSLIRQLRDGRGATGTGRRAVHSAGLVARRRNDEVGGSVPEVEGTRIYNTCVAVDPGVER